MSDKRWIEDEPGLYIRTPTRGAFKGKQVYMAARLFLGRTAPSGTFDLNENLL